MDKKVNKGKTESVSMTVQGVIFSEYPGNKVGWLHILSVVISPLLPLAGVLEVYSVSCSAWDRTSVLERSFHCTRTPPVGGHCTCQTDTGDHIQGNREVQEPPTSEDGEGSTDCRGRWALER